MEYWQCDPADDYLDPKLQGFRLVEDRYVSISVTATAGGLLVGRSLERTSVGNCEEENGGNMKKSFAILLVWILCVGGLAISVPEVHAFTLKELAKAAWKGEVFGCSIVTAVNPLLTDAEGDDLEVEKSAPKTMLPLDPCMVETFRSEMEAEIGSASIEEFCDHLSALSRGEDLPE